MMSTRGFGKRERAVGIGLTFGLIIGVVIGSMTGNMGLWIGVGVVFGILIGVTCATLLEQTLHPPFHQQQSQTNIFLQATGGSRMNPITQRINSSHPHTPAPRWKAFSVCAAMAVAAAVGFTTIAITSPASAQETSADSQRHEADSTVTEAQVHQRLDAAVANGVITQEQADRRFRDWQQRQPAQGGFPSRESMDEGVNAEVQRGKLTDMQAAGIMRVYARLAMGLESGRLSVDEALAILEERSIAIYEGEQGQPSITRQDYANAQTAMQKMVDAGEITKEQMDARLIEMRQMIGRESTTNHSQGLCRGTSGDAEDGRRRRDHQSADGWSTGQNAKDDRQKPTTDHSKGLRQCGRQDDRDGQDLAKMTREQMQIRLQDDEEDDGQGDSTITREDYAKAAADMQKMVEEGKITEDADEAAPRSDAPDDRQRQEPKTDHTAGLCRCTSRDAEDGRGRHDHRGTDAAAPR